MSAVAEAIERAYELVRRIPPFPARIWFVDRPAEYFATYRLWPMRFSGAWQASAWPQLLEWYSAIATPEERARAPWWCALPGVWVEYNNGMVVYPASLNPRPKEEPCSSPIQPSTATA